MSLFEQTVIQELGGSKPELVRELHDGLQGEGFYRINVEVMKGNIRLIAVTQLPYWIYPVGNSLVT